MTSPSPGRKETLMSCPVCAAEAVAPPRCRTCGRPLLQHHTGETVLALEEVSHTYGSDTTKVTALDRATLRVRRGDVTLVVGPSGGGKTTALLAMGLLLSPESGSVSVSGTEMAAAAERERARVRLLRLGFVFQQFNLLKALTATENVAVPLLHAKVGRKHATGRAHQLLEQLDVGRRGDHRPADLSGGEKQRVAVARALALGPEVLLADEPTANLDSASGRKVIGQLAETARGQGSAVVIVTHDTRLVSIADRTLWLEDGKLTESSVEEFDRSAVPVRKGADGGR